jgi:hypothetical protein
MASEDGLPRLHLYVLFLAWLNSSDGERVGIGLVAVNAVVFLAWQIRLPAVRLFMYEHFTHHPLSGRTYTLQSSVFSHAVSYYYYYCGSPSPTKDVQDLRPESRSKPVNKICSPKVFSTSAST